MPVPALSYRIFSKISRLIAPHVPLNVYRRVMPRNPIGFFYHAVSDTLLPHLRHLYPNKSIAEFEQDLVWLKQNYTLLTYSDLLAQSLNHPITQLPNPSAFLSFDDGFVECYSVVRPLLLKHNIPCIFFLATDWIDNQAMYYRGKMSLCIEKLTQLAPATQKDVFRQLSQVTIQNSQLTIDNFQSFASWILSHQQSSEPIIDQVCTLLQIDIADYLRTRQPFLTRAQIQEMQAEGFVFGAHTKNHPKLNTLPQEAQAAQISASCRIMCEITGQDQVPFAFPFSGTGVDRDFLARLRSENPQIGLIFDTQKLQLDRPFVFQRIWADKPNPSISPNRNLEHWIHEAYVREFSR